MRQGNRKLGFLVTATCVVTLVLAGGLAAQSSEVYTWTDKDGVVHFSGLPPSSVQANQIHVEGDYEPGTTDAYPADEADVPEAETEAEAEAEEPTLSAAQQRREQIASNRADKRKADAESRQGCDFHRQRLAQIEPSRRVFHTDENGETARMDDDQRMQLIEESKAYLARYCR